MILRALELPESRGWIVVRIVVTSALVALAISQVPLGALGDALSAVAPVPLLAGTLLLLAGQMVSGLRWRTLATARGASGSPAWFVRAYMRGAFYNNVLPGGFGGDASRVLQLRRVSNTETAIRSVIVDRISGLVALAVAGALLLPLTPYADGHGAAWAAPAVATIVAGFGLAGLRGVNVGSWVGWTIAYITLWVSGLLLLAQALGIEIPALAGPAVVATVGVAMALPISIGAVGTREAGFVIALVPLGVMTADAIALGLLFGVALLVVGLCGAPFATGALRRGPRQPVEA
jgi:glycosyltransferase 2 family protein